MNRWVYRDCPSFLLLAFVGLFVSFAGGRADAATDNDNQDSQAEAHIIRPANANMSYRYFRHYRAQEDEDDERLEKNKADEEDLLTDDLDDDDLDDDDLDDDDLNDEDDLDDDLLDDEDAPRRTESTFGLEASKPIQMARIDIRETHSVSPPDRSSELGYGGSAWPQFYASPKTFAWAAPNIHYHPLYFEDVALERYGQTAGINPQPIRSAIHFFKSVVFLPNQMRHDHPQSCDYPLGFCRPGSSVSLTQQLHYLGQPNR